MSLRQMLREFNDCKQLLDDIDTAVYLVLAILAHCGSQSVFGDFQWKQSAKFLVLPFGLIYLMRLLRTEEFQNDPALTTVLAFRCSIVCWLVHNALAVPVVYALQFTSQRFKQSRKRWTRQRSQIQEVIPTPVSVETPQAIVGSRETVMTEKSEQAKIDFEMEKKVIDNATLDDDEREAALTQIKQKYLERLAELLR